MCTVENHHRILVCDVAIHRVREAASRAFGDAVQFTPIPGRGTRVEVPPTEDPAAFRGAWHGLPSPRHRQIKKREELKPARTCGIPGGAALSLQPSQASMMPA